MSTNTAALYGKVTNQEGQETKISQQQHRRRFILNGYLSM